MPWAVNEQNVLGLVIGQAELDQPVAFIDAHQHKGLRGWTGQFG